MTIVPLVPIKSLHGKVCGENHGYHVRTNHRGLVFSAKSGTPQKHPTPNMLANQEKMRLARQRAYEIYHDPAQRSAYEKAFSQQKRCFRLWDFIRSEVFRSLQ